MKKDKKSKFTPIDIKLTVGPDRLAVLEDIHGCIADVSQRLANVLPQSFPKEGTSYIETIISSLEQIEYYWKQWVLEDFKREMNSTDLFKGVGIQRVNPWDELEKKD